ncbi:MAG: hypothetical protein PHV28_13040 [Kiritimatiellae bacterium]|nr:hypothetical protein [Kiritimatiellia bacterium]
MKFTAFTATLALGVSCVCCSPNKPCQTSRRVPVSAPAATFTSMAKWVYAEPADNPATNAYLRLTFYADKEIKNAYFRIHCEKGGHIWVNGRAVNPRLWAPSREFFGHVKADHCDFTEQARPGRNVIAVELKPSMSLVTCRGLILRGEVEFADGSKLDLVSDAAHMKASGKAYPGWSGLAFDDSQWERALEIGDVFCPPWSRWGNVPECFCIGGELDEYRTWLAHERERISVSSLAGEQANPNARIVYAGDVPGIEVNGQAYAPVIDMHVELADSPWRRKDIENMRKAGVRFISIEGINRFRIADNTYDFTPLDIQMMQILKDYPEAYFFFSYGSGVYSDEWARQHPDECAGFAIETKESNIYNYWCTKPAPSFASKLYREHGAQTIKEFGAYVKTRIWGRRVVGIWTAFGGSGDGMPAGCYSMPDTGVAMTKAFRRRLTDKYQTDAALQTAWGDKAVTLATATVPGKEAREGWGGFLRDLSAPGDRRIDDYYDCYHREFSDYILALGKAVKEALPGRLSAAYHGYVILSYNPEGSTARCEDILASPYIDMLFATTRGYNLTDGLHRHLHSMFHRYGKLSMIEGDIRTHLCYKHGQSQAHWSCKTPEETRATYSKIVANSFMYGSGYHIVAFNAYTNINTKLVWTDCPETIEPIAKGVKAWDKLFKAPPTRNADVAVVFDSDEVWRDGHPNYWPSSITADNIAVFPLQTLNFCGYAYDMLAPEDFLAEKRDYRAVVFLNSFRVKPELREKLIAKIRKPGVTAIWHFAPGLQTDEGFSAKSMTDLTGIKLGFRRQVLEHDAHNVAGGIYRFYVAPKGYKEGPRVYADDPEAEVVAKWIDDGTSAYVKKALPGGARAIFAGVPIRDVKHWARLFDEAGCHAFTKPGFMVRRNSKLIEIFSGKDCTVPPESQIMKGQIDQSDRVEVRLERKYALVRDILTGEVVAENADAFTLRSEHPKLWLLETE